MPETSSNEFNPFDLMFVGNPLFTIEDVLKLKVETFFVNLGCYADAMPFVRYFENKPIAKIATFPESVSKSPKILLTRILNKEKEVVYNKEFKK